MFCRYFVIKVLNRHTRSRLSHIHWIYFTCPTETESIAKIWKGEVPSKKKKNLGSNISLSSSKLTSLHLVLCSSSSHKRASPLVLGPPPVLLPGGVHLKATFVNPVLVHSQHMSQPSFFLCHVWATWFLVEVMVGDFAKPKDQRLSQRLLT